MPRRHARSHGAHRSHPAAVIEQEAAPLATPERLLAEQAFSRTAGAPLLLHNDVELLIDAAAHFEAWLQAIRAARQRVLLESYLVSDDAVGVAFRDALIERARAGVLVAVIVDWLGCLGQSNRRFWEPLRAAGGQVRVFNPPRLGEPLSWLSRDHRKLLVVDGLQGFLSGVCISARWLGDPAHHVPPWRDTGVALRGPAVSQLEIAFADSWSRTGAALETLPPPSEESAGPVALRVVADQPVRFGLYRLDQLIAAIARRTLWLTDAYFVGFAPYVQTLAAAARDGVDVRMLVPSTSDIPAVAALSRTGYRPLLKAGIRVFEWNGSMLHAKTSVADSRWARVGSSNMNLASWMGNREIAVAVDDAGFAGQLAAQYQRDLQNATEIVLARRRHRRSEQVVRAAQAPMQHRAAGRSSRAAAGALRIASSMSAALANRRVLDEGSRTPLYFAFLALIGLAAIAALRPAWVGWPLSALAAWLALNLAVRIVRLGRRRRARERTPPD